MGSPIVGVHAHFERQNKRPAVLRAVDERKKLGAFYTPDSLSQFLCEWAIRAPSETVLEPSFGGCGLLRSSKERLAKLGARKPIEQIYGCDIDPTAFRYLSEMLESPVDLKNFVQGSFLDYVSPSNWPNQFDAIIANPPYIPYQNLDSDVRKQLRSKDWPVSSIGGRASLWAYFILESLSKLKKYGRMAWILPGAVLNANYAKPILRYLATAFERSLALIVRDRIFLEEGTDEETVILLLENYSTDSVSGTMQVCRTEKLSGIPEEIQKWNSNQQRNLTEGFHQAQLSLRKCESKILDALHNAPEAKQLGKMATIQIGLVTGANDFFVLNKSSLVENGLSPNDCKPILSKFNQAPGLTFGSIDFSARSELDARVFLIDASKVDTSYSLQRYLNSFSKERLNNTSTFKKRRKWDEPDDNKIPDAFFPVMHHTGPRIVLNEHRLTCTNTTHRLYFEHHIEPHQRRLIAISLLTSFSQLSAEMTGRTYGSGVLKHEPREAEKIQLLLPSLSPSTIDDWFEKIDKKLRSGLISEASSCADELIYSALEIRDFLDVSSKLQNALKTIREARRPSKRKA